MFSDNPRFWHKKASAMIAASLECIVYYKLD